VTVRRSESTLVFRSPSSSPLRMPVPSATATTKGGHTDTIPFPEWLKPFLAHAIAASDGETVFPAASGGTRSEHTDAVAIIQVAMKAAGLVAGWEHVCRRCKARATKGQGEPYSERRPERNDELRCPRCGMRLWATPIPRPFRFHDLRHTAATLMIPAGGKPHEVQRILRHKSLDTTMRIYAHLFAEDLRPVVNLLPAVPPPVETSASARVALLSHSALSVEIGGPESQVKTPEDSGPSSGARYRIRTCGLRLRRQGSLTGRRASLLAVGSVHAGFGGPGRPQQSTWGRPGPLHSGRVLDTVRVANRGRVPGSSKVLRYASFMRVLPCPHAALEERNRCHDRPDDRVWRRYELER
jgi:DNA-directed RNA polymerase subunit RPC12/RpoP